MRKTLTISGEGFLFYCSIACGNGHGASCLKQDKMLESPYDRICMSKEAIIQRSDHTKEAIIQRRDHVRLTVS